MSAAPLYCCGVVVEVGEELAPEPIEEPPKLDELPKLEPPTPVVMLPADCPPAPELLLTTVRSASGS